MSIRVVYQDDSSETLLREGSIEANHDDEEDNEDESLASLLGITSKDVVSLDEEAEEKVELDTVVCEVADAESEGDETEKLISNGDIAEKQSKGSGKDESESLPETENDDCTDTRSKRDSDFDFKKIFGSALLDHKPCTSKTTDNSDQADQGEDDSESDNNNDESNLKLLIPIQSKNSGKVDPVRPQTAANMDSIQHKRARLLRREASQRSKIICGIVFIVLLVCLSLGLLAIGWFCDIFDLYIIGGIFGGGTVFFIVIFIFIRCTAVTLDNDYKMLFLTDSPDQKV